MSYTLGSHRLFSQVVTAKHRNQTGEGLRTCVGTVTVCIIGDCPGGNIWHLDLFHDSFEVSCMDSWPHPAWWSITWLWCGVGLATPWGKLAMGQAPGWGLGTSPGPSGSSLWVVWGEDTGNGQCVRARGELRKSCVNSAAWFGSHREGDIWDVWLGEFILYARHFSVSAHLILTTSEGSGYSYNPQVHTHVTNLN